MRLTDVKAGDTIIADTGFDCMEPGPKTVLEDSDGLYVTCKHVRHYLIGQLNEDGTALIGFMEGRPADPTNILELDSFTLEDAIARIIKEEYFGDEGSSTAAAHDIMVLLKRRGVNENQIKQLKAEIERVRAVAVTLRQRVHDLKMERDMWMEAER